MNGHFCLVQRVSVHDRYYCSLKCFHGPTVWSVLSTHSLLPFQMHQQGILKTDDLITRFFRLCTEMCVDLCYRALSEQTHSPTLVRTKCFHTLDAFVRLIALLVKHSGDTNNIVTKINLLNKVSIVSPFLNLVYRLSVVV